MVFLASSWEQLGPTQRQHLTKHCQAVSDIAVRLGRIVGLAPAELKSLRLAGLLHDIGKCAVPESLLAKPDRLTPAERRVMDHHVLFGVRIAVDLGADPTAVDFIRQHHMHYRPPRDGSGRRDVPVVGARLLAIADALASMMSHRPYCAARTGGEALAELRWCAGEQFDPHIVRLAHRLELPGTLAA